MIANVDQRPLVTRQAFAKELSVSLPTLWRWGNDGLIPKPIRLGRRVGWPRSVVDDWKMEKGWPAPESATTGSVAQ